MVKARRSRPSGAFSRQVTFALALFSTAVAMHADQSITLRSGNGVVGAQDAQVRFVPYAVSQDTPPVASDFAAAQAGTFAYVNAPYSAYLTPAQFSDPLAQWIGTTSSFGGGSALYAIPFNVTDPIIAAASLSLGYSVDNAVHGVYINGTEISNFVNDGDYHGEYYYMRSDIASLLIPNATNWLYIKTYDYGGLAGLMYSATITTQGTAPGAPTITPNQGGNSGSVSFRIIASGFEAGTSPGATPAHANPTVMLTGIGSTVAATNVNVVSPNVLTGTFNLAGASPGIGTITVTNSDGTSTVLKNAFTILAGGLCMPGMRVVGTPAVLGRNEYFYITVTNVGSVDCQNVQIVEPIEPWQIYQIGYPTPSSIGQDPFPYNGSPYNSQLDWTDPSIPPGASATSSYTVEQDPNFPTDAGTTTSAQSCTASQLTNLDNTCNQQLETGRKILEVANPICDLAGDLSKLEWDKVCQLAEFENYAQWGVCMGGGHAICSDWFSGIRASLDPNDLNGPSGYGTPQWIQAPSQISYTLSFNNLATATKAATNIAITSTFDPSTLDLTTLAVNAVTIGSNSYPLSGIPLSVQPFSQDIDLRPAQNLLVRVTGSLDQTTNQASVNFLSLDPSTGLTPTDPTIGLLAPNTGGVVLFNANPKPNLPTGTAIAAQGSVVFDTNAAIATNVWSNGIDITPPVSHITALPSQTNNPSFTVAWTGTDVGSGVKDFTIYVSDNGGPYSVWLQNTLGMSGSYPGVVGHTYSFYSLSEDNVLNQEPVKSSAEAIVQVVPIINTSTTLSSSASSANVGTTIAFTATVTSASVPTAPTGTVTFNDSGTVLGVGTLSSSGTATFSSATLTAGTHSITATYSGDSNYASSTSAVFTQTVLNPAFTFTISPTSLTVSRNQPGQLTATITPSGGFKSNITFACFYLPAQTSCTFSPTTVTADGTNTAMTSTLTIAADVKLASSIKKSNSREHERQTAAFLALILGLPCLIITKRAVRRKLPAVCSMIAFCILFGTAVCLSGCNTLNSTTPSGTYTVTITASGGQTIQTVNLPLTVQ
jgi:hypothetical protein